MNDSRAMRPVRRIVTGHDENGKSVFLSVGPPPQFHGEIVPAVEFVEQWHTPAAPVPLDRVPDHEPNDRPLSKLGPDAGGTVLRVLDIKPGHVARLKPRADGRHPGMHRTETLDYGILIEGELWLILDDDEVCLRPGDVVIQRGTDHAWENRTDRTVRIAFVLIDGKFAGALAGILAHGDET